MSLESNIVFTKVAYALLVERGETLLAIRQS
jgi:hypothetical protein